MAVSTPPHTTAPPETPPLVPPPRDPWRDQLGRYLPGNPGGPGNPAAREMAALRAYLRAFITKEMFDHVLTTLWSLSVKGNVGALKLFLLYFCGQPDRSVDCDRLEIEELKLQLEAAAVID